MKMFLNIVVIPCVLFFAIMGVMFYSITSTASVTETNSVAPSIATISEPCVLQDAVIHDGTWFLYDKPAVFDEEACEVMSQIFRDEVNVPVAATAEFINGCYVIHLD